LSDTVLKEIVTIVNSEVKQAKDKLLTEENGRAVALLQGKVYGWRQLIENIEAEFSLFSVLVLDTNGKPIDLPGLTDDDVFRLEGLVKEFVESEEWKKVKDRVAQRIGQLKDHLLYSAEKSRELDISQGQYKALIWPNNFFSDVSNIASWRRQKQDQEAKRKKEEFDFDGNASVKETVQAGEELISSTCPSCGGNCYRGESNEEPCEECGATGVVYRAKNLDKRVDCATCKGTGNVEGLDLVWGPCTDCKGTGKVEVPEAVPALLLMFDNIEAWKAELDAKALKLWPDNGSLSETSTDEQWVEFYGGRSTDAVIEDELANPEKGESSEEVPGEVGPEGEDPNESDRAEEPQAS